MTAARINASPITGRLVRAGTFQVADEVLSGLFVEMTEAELAAVKYFPLYQRVTVAALPAQEQTKDTP